MTLVARHSALSDIGLRRKTNEDTFVAAPPLFAVCDGMGGAQAGEVASRLAAEALTAGVANGSTLLVAADQANAVVFARAGEDEGHTGMGTTLTAALLEEDTGHFVHIGDSRAYLLRDGELTQVSEDHSLVAEMVRDGRLTEEEAAAHPHRSVLSRALGTDESVDLDEFAVDLRPGDVLLLCSDGLSGPVTDRAIAEALGLEDPDEAVATLIAEARRHGGPDNITAIVLRFEEGPAAASLEWRSATRLPRVRLKTGRIRTAGLPPTRMSPGPLPLRRSRRRSPPGMRARQAPGVSAVSPASWRSWSAPVSWAP